MHLIKRYIHAVKQWLPEKEQEEFLAELEEDLKSQVEEKERTLDRALTQEELATLLKERGHPTLVATRLLPQQHLIGPAWYPIWRLSLRAIIVWILAPVFLLILGPLAALSSSEPGTAYLQTALRLPMTALTAAASVTFVIALLERLEIKVNIFQSWNPAHLPAAPTRTGERIPRCGSAIEMTGEMFLLLWWVGIIPLPTVREMQLTLGPGWEAVYWPVLLVLVTGLALATVKLMRPDWRPWYSVASIFQHALMAALAGMLMYSDAPVSVMVAGATAERLAQLASIVDWSVGMTLFGVMAVAAVTMFVEARTLLRARLRNGAVTLSPSGACG